MPGNPLYVVESFVENIEVKIAGMIGGPEMKSKAIANNAEERLAEARYLADQNKTEKAAKAMQRYSQGLNHSRDIARGLEDTNLGQKIENVSNRNKQTLEEVKKKVPEQAKKGIERARNKTDNQKPDIPDKARERSENPGKAENTGLNSSKPEESTPGGIEVNDSEAKPAKIGKSRENLTSGKNISNSPDIENKTINKDDNDELNTSREVDPETGGQSTDTKESREKTSDRDEESSVDPSESTSEDDSKVPGSGLVQ